MAVTPALSDFEVLVFDIEGTVCSISFVHDVLFPYALDALPGHLDQNWDSPIFAHYRDAFPPEYRNVRVALEAHVRDLVSRDVKAPYLKALQGHLWKQGYESGEIKAPLFPDVAPLIIAAHALGKRIIIYSSGSVPAQKLLFAHTNASPQDLTPLISEYFDTVNAGPKTEPGSYATILASHPDIAPARWLFLSDNLKEVRAAMASGMRSLPVTRPGNAPYPSDDQLAQFAIPDFSPESDDRIRASLHALEKLR
ncbi:enolase-phosphatase [Purpureocillium lilacinum]|uniref:Enolase-phosphatase E1 n=1 Tax=Purpureocillium lilacinum TaxID=33203 RepID=A0A179HL15_PURLI|nr:enolase-phosphatase [Purpureocillium lilacinum]OAQ83911.1 enolase-phosphatase [Purpureocillium lilacinum]OAQ90694.1 enolase-phosphatase [Purpureocillium lilacinum]GJN68249.1 enolase-phosphatase E1 [Purpureocillium lilacinum]GJN78078.1 enolase-phosphatase E1 [Purpureocillium lilacinum]